MTERSLRIRWAALAVGAFLLLMGLEVLTEEDALDAGDLLGEALQTALLVATATGVTMLTARFQAQREEQATLIRDLQTARAEGAAWRDRAQRYVAGLGEEIEKQFEAWGLTGAEREVGLLMLKGLSHREVAALRGTTEATARHQARTIYQKSGLPGRSAFCAYFLEDLLPAREPGRPSTV